METTLAIPPIRPTTDASSAPPFFRLLGTKELVFIELQGSIARLDPETRKLGRLVQQEDGRIYLVVGYQKMEGTLITLKKPFAVLRRAKHQNRIDNNEEDVTMNEDTEEEYTGEVQLEVVEVCRKKIFFGSRPEPLNEMEV